MRIASLFSRLGLLVLVGGGLVACGGGGSTGDTPAPSAGSTGNTPAPSTGSSPVASSTAPTDSYIQYLADNHAAYRQTGDTAAPAATFDDANFTLRWTITAQTPEQAKNLAAHIAFMEHAIETGQQPRSWDKLFLLDAYFGRAQRIHATVTQVEQSVVIDKVATDACSYALMKTHAQGVHDPFFTQGKIQVNFSLLAEQVIASEACASERDALNAYIDQNLTPAPKGAVLLGS